MDKHFGKMIWTNHALKRLSERGISQSDAWATIRSPQETRYAKAQGAWVYYRTYGSEKIEVVAKQNEKKEWVILSVWSKILDNKEMKVEPLLFLLLKKLLRQS